MLTVGMVHGISPRLKLNKKVVEWSLRLLGDSSPDSLLDEVMELLVGRKRER